MAITTVLLLSCLLKVSWSSGQICVPEPAFNLTTAWTTSNANWDTDALDIIKQKLPVIPDTLLVRFTKLIQLRVSDCDVESVHRNAFVTLKSLKYLDLSRNRLRNFTRGAFRNQLELTVLILSNNHFVTIGDVLSALVGPNNLRELYLNNNKITGSFNELSKLGSLTILDLSNNHMGTVNATFNLPKLCEINLESNAINAKVLKNILRNLRHSSLKVLRLGNVVGAIQNKNIYYNIPNGTFPSLPRLLYLDLTSSDTFSVENGSFKGKIDSLETLILKDNKIGKIPDELNGMDIVYLDVSSNVAYGQEFKLINGGYNLKRLEVLDLTNNQISLIENSTFLGVSNLKILNLSSNAIVTIQPYSFSDLGQLNILDLSVNKMEEIVNFTFHNLLQLETLILDRNDLKVYPWNNPFLKLHKLKSLSFRYNSLCQIWWYLLLDQTSLEYMDGRDNKLESWKRRAFVNTVKIKTVLLQKNEITKVSQPMLIDLLHVPHVDISDNPFNCSDCDLIQTQIWIKNRTNHFDNFKCQDIDLSVQYCLLNASLPSTCGTFPFAKSLILPLGLSGVVFVLVTLSLTFAAYRLRWFTKYYYYMFCIRLGLRSKPVPVNGHVYDAYISYSKKDAEWLQQYFLPKLENNRSNLKFYVRQRDSELGRHVIDNIIEGIDRSEYFVALVSENYLKSCWRMWELKLAVARAIKDYTPNIIVINLDGASEKATNKSVKHAVTTQVYLQWSEETFKQRVVIEKVAQKLSKVPAVTSL